MARHRKKEIKCVRGMWEIIQATDTDQERKIAKRDVH